MDTTVSDDALDAAASMTDEQPAEQQEDATPEITAPQEAAEGDDAGEKEPEPEQEQEQVPEAPKEKPEPEDNAERSRLGRKVKYLEEKLQDALTVIDRLGKHGGGEEEENFEEDFIPTSRADLDRYLDYREKQRDRAAKEYENNYKATVGRMGLDLDDSEYNEVLKEMLENHNVKRSADPEVDAQMNFYAAQSALYRKKLAEAGRKRNPLEKNKDVAPPPGGPIGSQNAGKSKPLPQLDPIAADFAKRVGLSEDSINKALSGDAPAYLLKPSAKG